LNYNLWSENVSQERHEALKKEKMISGVDITESTSVTQNLYVSNDRRALSVSFKSPPYIKFFLPARGSHIVKMIAQEKFFHYPVCEDK
jgi:hypothetical protein